MPVLASEYVIPGYVVEGLTRTAQSGRASGPSHHEHRR
jgi:hypothetical protein